MSTCFSYESIRTPFDLNEQSDILKGSEVIRISKFYNESRQGKFVSYIYDDTRTLYDAFRRGAKESNNGPCLGWRDDKIKSYQWLHYNETLLRAKNFGSGLILHGIQPSSQTLIGIYSQNNPEWILTEQACYTYSIVLVPLHDTLGQDSCVFIINQAEISVMICEDDKKCNFLLSKAPRCLRKIIVIKETRSSTQQRARNRGIELLKFSEVEKLGSQKNYPEVPPKPADLSTVCYTSGTTGSPKGVMLTHQNVMSGISAVLLQLGEFRPTQHDVMISFLPLAQMLERCCENGMYMVGGSVGFFSGDIKTLSDDMKILKPTVMPAVPRLLNRLYDKIRQELDNSFVKRTLFNIGIRSKESDLKKCIIHRNSIWDKTLFKKIQEEMGGNLRLMIVGSAPLAGNVMTFARCVLGCLILEGYGQTECCAPITLTLQGDCIPEHVGPPVACCCIKLIDVPEMEYYTVNNQGEICVKGANIFAGYFKNPELSAEAIDEHGWHHTGDIGMWLLVRDLYLHPDPFSTQNGLLSPSLKLKRSQLKAYFKPQLEDLYQNLK
ncbi:long-chain-fatty-acid--CoA ligase 5 isoform X2 [Copidosoma floridanum]|uniref:long-chain-fatty-acid--CoA ligase 5 isoform X2 n=2 Tax=Copidosoma floridanum TaxID=29053 RepID=UPI000C6F8F91|nr:long-chain-fatty-acid--CoA ligase 5 isoform X2 [Copidosoma floridanum]